MNSDASTSSLHIGHLRLRIPGDSQDTGHAVSQHLAKCLEELAVGTRPVHIGAMRLRLAAPGHASPEAIANSVAAAIGNSITRHQNATHA